MISTREELLGDLDNAHLISSTGWVFFPQLSEEFDPENKEDAGGLWFGVDPSFNAEGKVTRWLKSHGWHWSPEPYDKGTLFAFPNDKVYYPVGD